jgi:hypothetical protein
LVYSIVESIVSGSVTEARYATFQSIAESIYVDAPYPCVLGWIMVPDAQSGTWTLVNTETTTYDWLDVNNIQCH